MSEDTEKKTAEQEAVEQPQAEEVDEAQVQLTVVEGSGTGDASTGEASVRKARFAALEDSSVSAECASMDLLLDIQLEVSAELGRTSVPVRDVLSLGPGSIVSLSKTASEPVDVLVNGKLIARGEVVVVEENFGVRITEILGRPTTAAQASG